MNSLLIFELARGENELMAAKSSEFAWQVEGLFERRQVKVLEEVHREERLFAA